MHNFPYVLSFLEGLLTFISPCILPMLPIYFFYLAGAAEEKDIRRARLLYNSLAFILGFTIIFVLLGATATALGGFLKDNIEIFRKISGVIIIILGLNFTGLIPLNFLNMQRGFTYHPKDFNFLKSVIFGMVFAFGWTPCVGAFLGSALLLAGNANSIVQGVVLLLLYSLGLGLPFVLSAVLLDTARKNLHGLQKYGRTISIVSGLVLIAAGLLLVFDKLI